MMLRYCIEKACAAFEIAKRIEAEGGKCFIMKNGSGFLDGRVIDIPSGFESVVSQVCFEMDSDWC